MSNPYRPEVVVITGASAGVGRATVREFAKRGARIGLIARGRECLEAAQQNDSADAVCAERETKTVSTAKAERLESLPKKSGTPYQKDIYRTEAHRFSPDAMNDASGRIDRFLRRYFPAVGRG